VLPDEPLMREETDLICSNFCGQRDPRDLVAKRVLPDIKSVVVTPHSAFDTREAVQRVAEVTVETIGEPSRNAGCGTWARPRSRLPRE